MISSDFHTHTIYSDGKNTPEEMIVSAINKGLTAFGISDHAYVSFDNCRVEKENIPLYLSEVKRLKAKYADKIKILCGIEADCYSDDDVETYDYVIGSVHYIKIGGKYFYVDLSAESTLKTIKEAFGGDKYSFVEAYFENVAEVCNKFKVNVVGHFDLITKFERFGVELDEENSRYEAAVNGALHAINKNAIFEVNTGGITRGYKTMPYPSEKILKKLASENRRVILSSDAHNENQICGHFSEAEKLCLKHKLKIVDSPVCE